MSPGPQTHERSEAPVTLEKQAMDRAQSVASGLIVLR